MNVEPLNHPVWEKRIRCLASLLVVPLTVPELRTAARGAWGWAPHLADNTVAAGEGKVLRARRVAGRWLIGRVPGSYSGDSGKKLGAIEKQPKGQGHNARAPLSISRRCPGCKEIFRPKTMGQKFHSRFCARQNKGKV
jgi:hypothetical protein